MLVIRLQVIAIEKASGFFSVSELWPFSLRLPLLAAINKLPLSGPIIFVIFVATVPFKPPVAAGAGHCI